MSSQQSVILNLDGIISSSPSMKECINLVANAANCDASVLITGDTGTGKELFAWAIHNNSSRADKNFVVVDCTVLPETLVESLLFGYEKGSFTGASTSKEGLIKQADGGTVFLDEVGELPLSIQKRFLRVLQEHHFRPVGGKSEIYSDFRLIAATNRNLETMVENQQFRKDLIYRLKSLHINLPPLNQRKEDIRKLLIYYTAKLCENNNIATKGFSPEFFQALVAYDWPGNVREFINTIESVIAESLDAPILFPYHLPANIRIRATQVSIGDGNSYNDRPDYDDTSSSELPTLKLYREARLNPLEQEYIEKLMVSANGNIKEACRISGLSRSRLYGLMKKYNITRKLN